MNASFQPYFLYWGKATSEKYITPKWHPLVYHSLDVAAVAAVWWDSIPAIPRLFRTAFQMDVFDDRQLRATVLFFVSLHDIGKFDIRFQSKVPDILKECWPAFDMEDVELSDSCQCTHGDFGYFHASREYKSWFGPDTDFMVLQPWIASVTGHHGEFPDESKSRCQTPPAAEEHVLERDREARQQFVDTLTYLFLEPAGVSLSDLPYIADRSFCQLLAGFCSISDWIGSNTAEFCYQQIGLTSQQYFSNRYRDTLDNQVLTKFGLIRPVSPYAGVQALIRQDCTPRGIQSLINELSAEPGLTIIEAPTGSGKTEAALAYAWRLLDNRLADSIVFALPTQATANAMLKRIETVAEKLFGQNGANVVLAHGKRDFSHEFKKFIKAGKHPFLTEDASVECSEWLAQSRKRVFLGQIGICTVDQVLLSVLPVRHKFVRSYGLSKSVLIVDEIHTYDSYMHGLLDGVLQQQRKTGGSAILLSATLSETLRNQIVESWDSEPIVDRDYPLITHISDGKPVRCFRPEEKHRPRRREVQIECLPLPNAMPDDPLLSRIIQAAESGCRVGVIVNMVRDAQATARLLRDPAHNSACIPVDTFHARYRFLDRQEKEMMVLDQYGLNAKRGSGRILVATQVVEQSLDLDFDWMVTQICPIDLLFQRLGRLHRHDRQRPSGYEMPACTILTVENNNYQLHQEIYGNARVLWRTEQLARTAQNGRFAFPEAYRDLIQHVYESHDWDEPENITGEYCAYAQIQRSKFERAKRMTTMSMAQFRDDNEGITSLTRDGEMSLTIIPVLRNGEYLDGDQSSDNDEKGNAELMNLNTIPVPYSWGKFLKGYRIDDDGRYLVEFTAQNRERWISTNGSTTFIYTRDFGLEKE